MVEGVPSALRPGLGDAAGVAGLDPQDGVGKEGQAGEGAGPGEQKCLLPASWEILCIKLTLSVQHQHSKDI